MYLHLHQDGFEAGDDVVALPAVDCWGSGRDGVVCHSLAAGHQADGDFHRLYVQGNQSDIRTSVRLLAVW